MTLKTPYGCFGVPFKFWLLFAFLDVRYKLADHHATVLIRCILCGAVLWSLLRIGIRGLERIVETQGAASEEKPQEPEHKKPKDEQNNR